MDISDSGAAQQWLENFPEKRDSNQNYSDRFVAEKLLQEVQFASTDSVRRGLGGALLSMLKSGEIEPKVFYSNVISINEIPPIPDDQRSKEILEQKNECDRLYKEWKQENSHLYSERLNIRDVDPFSIDSQISYLQAKDDIPPGAPHYFQHSAFETYYPDQPLLYISGNPIAAAPGSEAITANLLGKLSGEMGDDFVRTLVSGEELIEEARTILLVSDFAGTGVQIVEYAKTFNANKLIRKRRTNKKIKIVLLCYAVTSLAEKWIRINSHLFDQIKFVRGVQALSTLRWTHSKKQELKCFLTKYPINKQARREAFGYKKSGALFCSGFSVSNNLPMVLRQSNGPIGNWRALFTHENILQGLTGGTEAPLSVATLIRNHPDFEPGPRLSAATKSPYYADVLKIIDVLFLLYLNESQAGSSLNINEISGKLRVKIDEVEKRLEILKMGGYVDGNLKLTEEGKSELQSAQKVHYKKKFSLRERSQVYYPSSLRLGESWGL